MSTKQSKPSGQDTYVKFDGETRGFSGGGNSCNTECGTEVHDSPKAQGKRFGQESAISKCVSSSTDSMLDESKVCGKRGEKSAVAKVRSANNLLRDQNTNLGRGKNST